jgi:hypothetical protein
MPISPITAMSSKSAVNTIFSVRPLDRRAHGVALEAKRVLVIV